MTASQKETVLAIDDEPTNLFVIRQILRDDYRVLAAVAEQDGIAIAKAQHPDIVLLDVIMPGVGGYEVCRILKSDPATSLIPIIFVSAMDGVEDEAKGLGLGAVDYITKPVRPAILRARIRTHLALKSYQDKLRDLSLRDDLTQLSNRRCFFELYEREWNRAVRERTSLSLLMVDVDYFKNYNDSYGHMAGDLCLCEIATALTSVIRRSTDIVARYGGEEFICVLPDTDEGGARGVADAIHQRVLDLSLPHRASHVSSRVTVSIGATCARPTAEIDREDLIRAADALLYRAKDNGRNRTEYSDIQMRLASEAVG